MKDIKYVYAIIIRKTWQVLKVGKTNNLLYRNKHSSLRNYQQQLQLLNITYDDVYEQILEERPLTNEEAFYLEALWAIGLKQDGQELPFNRSEFEKGTFLYRYNSGQNKKLRESIWGSEDNEFFKIFGVHLDDLSMFTTEYIGYH